MRVYTPQCRNASKRFRGHPSLRQLNRSYKFFKAGKKMSNHFTGLSLGPPLGDQRLDLCDLYAFQSPTDPARTVLILNANPLADALILTPSTGSPSTPTAII